MEESIERSPHGQTATRVSSVCLALLGIVVVFVLAKGGGKPRSLVQRSLAKAKSDIMAIHGAVLEFETEHGTLPVSLGDLLVPDADGRTLLSVEELPHDPWGHLCGYELFPAARRGFRVFSLGSDGEPGGAGEDMDIDNLAILDRRL